MGRYAARSAVVWVLSICFGTTVLAQTELKPGFNIFSPEQDVEIGQSSAAEVEKQMDVVPDKALQDYITRVGNRLAREAPGPEFPYQFKVVNLAEVNAFAMPGGFMYIHRGLVEAAGNEAEMAGVMAHEIAHVALRHGTNQASKAYLAQAGLGVLWTMLGGGGGGSTEQIIQAVGGFGLNATFLKFSRDAEKQADLLGAQVLARAGYDPMAMADFFEELRELQGRDPSGLETFFSGHPAPANRSEYVKQEVAQLKVDSRPPTGDFPKMQKILKGMPKAPTMAEAAEKGGAPPAGQSPADASIGLPSSRFATFTAGDGSFTIGHPDNWRAVGSQQGDSATIIPEGGVLELGGQSHIVYGVMVSRFSPKESAARRTPGPFRGRNDLERLSNLLLEDLLQENSYLRAASGSAHRLRIDGKSAVAVTLQGDSPVTRKVERVDFYAVENPKGSLLYCLTITPESDFPVLRPVFDRMIGEIRIRIR